jgi:CheY-like chemotaxis protein
LIVLMMNAVSPQPSSHRLLIVEDEFVIARDLSKRLSQMGYEVCATASSGEKALVAADRYRPDLALMDISLKGDLDGIETAGMLEDRLNLPVVFLTAHADDAMLQRAKLTKPLGYILKPYTDQHLSVALEVAFYRDAVQRHMRDHERTLVRRETQMRSAIENAADAMIIVDEDGRIQLFNLAAEWMFGYSANDIAGNDLCGVLPTVASLFKAGSQEFWVEERHRSGAPLRIEISVVEWSADGRRYSTLTVRDQSRLRNAVRQLRRQGQELLKINAKLDRFAHIVSHELRMPVRAVRHAARRIIEDLDGKISDSTHINVDQIAGHSARATHMIDDLLDYSRAGFESRGAQKVSLVEEIAEIESGLDSQFGATIKADGPIASLHTHRAALRLVLRNLIENIVYHSCGPSVELSVTCEEQIPHYLFKIIDIGACAPADVCQGASVPLVRAEQDDAHRARMGLTLARWVIEENGGTVGIHPKLAGRTQIWFSWARIKE